MRFAKARDQQRHDKLSAELDELIRLSNEINGRITWRASRLDALKRRTRCRKVRGCTREHGHIGAHQL